jgi:hypothetical protein
MTTKRQAIDDAKAALATARKAAAADDEKNVKARDGIAKLTLAAFLAACKAKKVDPSTIGSLVVNHETAAWRSGGIGGDKSQSMGRAAKVTSWVVGGKDIGSPMASKLIAAVYNVERAKDVYGKDSPERFIRKPAFIDKLAGRKIKVVRDGKASDAVAFLKA